MTTGSHKVTEPLSPGRARVDETHQGFSTGPSGPFHLSPTSIIIACERDRVPASRDEYVL